MPYRLLPRCPGEGRARGQPGAHRVVGTSHRSHREAESRAHRGLEAVRRHDAPQHAARRGIGHIEQSPGEPHLDEPGVGIHVPVGQAGRRGAPVAQPPAVHAARRIRPLIAPDAPAIGRHEQRIPCATRGRALDGRPPVIERVERRGSRPGPGDHVRIVRRHHQELRVGRVVQDERELETHITHLRHTRQGPLAPRASLRLDADDVARRVERWSAVEHEVQVGRIRADPQGDGVAVLEHGQRAPPDRVTAGLGRPAGGTRILAQQAVILLRIHHVVPQAGPFGGQLEIDRHPGVLEPLVEPREHDPSRETGLPDLPRETHVDGRHLLLVVAAVVHPLGLEMRHTARRRHAVLRHEHRSPGMMAPQVQQVAEVVRRSLGRARRPVSGIEIDEVGIVRVGMIRREIPGQVRRGRPNQHRVQCVHVVVVLLEPGVGGKAGAPPQGLLLDAARLGGVAQRVERRPVRIGDGPLGVVNVPFVLQQLVTLLRQPHVCRRAARHGEKPPLVGAAAARPPVVRVNRERLPLPSQHPGQHVIRDVGVVASPCVSRAGGDQRATVHHVHRPPHLAAEVALPARGVVVAAGWQLGPYALHEPEGVLGVPFVPPRERPIKRGREDGVQPHRVRVGCGDQLEPASIRGVVCGELGRELPRQRGAEVDPLHIERLPALCRPHLEALPLCARRDLRLGAARRGRGREPRVRAPREQLIDRVDVIPRQRDRSSQRADRLAPLAQPPPGHAQTVPPVRRGRVRGERALEQSLRLPGTPLAQQHEPGADGRTGGARTQRLGSGELGRRRLERAAPVGTPPAVDRRGCCLRTDRDRGVLRERGQRQDEHDGRTT